MTTRPLSILTALQVVVNVTLWLVVAVAARWATKTGTCPGGMMGWFFACAFHSCGIVAWVIWTWWAERDPQEAAWPLLLLGWLNLALMVAQIIVVPGIPFLRCVTIN